MIFQRLGLISLVLLLLCSPLPADHKHDKEEARKRIVRGILQAIIDSQSRGRVEPHPHLHLPPKPVIQVIPEEQTKLASSRQTLEGIGRNLEILAERVHKSRGQTAGTKEALHELNHMRALIAALVHESHTVRTLNELTPGIQHFDRDWRVTRTRLINNPIFERLLKTSVDNIDKYSLALLNRHGIQPQLNYQAIASAEQTARTYMITLLDDLDYELAYTPQKQQLLVQGQQIHQQWIQFHKLVLARADYKTLVSQFQAVETAWFPFQRQVSTIQNNYIARSLHKVSHESHEIRELLWLKNSIDRTALLQVVNSINQDLSHLFNDISLTTILRFPDPTVVPATADELQGLCAHFSDCIRRNESHEELVEAYGYLFRSWIEFSDTLRTVPINHMLRDVRSIHTKMIALRDPLRVDFSFNRTTACRYASGIEQRSVQFTRQMELWSKSPQGAQFAKRNQMLSQCRDFQKGMNQFHQHLLRTHDPKHCQGECTKLANSWRQLNSYVAQAPPEYRKNLQPLADEMSNSMLNLQIMFTE